MGDLANDTQKVIPAINQEIELVEQHIKTIKSLDETEINKMKSDLTSNLDGTPLAEAYLYIKKRAEPTEFIEKIKELEKRELENVDAINKGLQLDNMKLRIQNLIDKIKDTHTGEQIKKSLQSLLK